MALSVNRITNANLYIDGNNKLGQAEEISSPDIKFKFSEHKAIGMIGSIELPAGIEKIEAKIKWNSFYADTYAKYANPFKPCQIMIRANVETYQSSGRTGQQPLVVFLTGQFKNTPTGNFKQHDNVEYESTFNCTGVKQMINGVTVLEYDALANIYKVNGVDVFADYHTNTGA
jgi:hypothetical protein